MTFFVACAKGLEPILAEELQALGVRAGKQTVAGVIVPGSQQDAMIAVLWSRVASRVLWPIAEFACPDLAALYRACVDFPWVDHLRVTQTFVVDVHLAGNPAIGHAQFAAQRVKDAIADAFRAQHGARPSVDRQHPDVRLHVLVRQDRAQLAIDLGGRSLHQRGWRTWMHPAALKETLAAAVLYRAQWPRQYAQGGGLWDPMCGSGTLVIEAAWMAADVAPGLRTMIAGPKLPVPTRWLQFDQEAWRNQVVVAQQRASVGLRALRPVFWGSDQDGRAIQAAQQHAACAHLATAVTWQRATVQDYHAALPANGLVVCNPPYDHRLAADGWLYQQLGEAIERCAANWHVALLSLDEALSFATGLRARRRYRLYNGALPCLLIVCEPGQRLHSRSAFTAPQPRVTPWSKAKPVVGIAGHRVVHHAASHGPPPSSVDGNRGRPTSLAKPVCRSLMPLDEAGQMLANRLLKNAKKLKKWRARCQISCYRLYDADLPEYSAAIDVYHPADVRQVPYAVIQEYAPPAHIPDHVVVQRRERLQTVVQQVLQLPMSQVIHKLRLRGKGGKKYGHLAERKEMCLVREGHALLWVNLTDYVDTGLFLDHRPLRMRLAQEAKDQRFLNLFCYTGVATVHAAMAGAVSTTSVDLSAGYLQWCTDNLMVNAQVGKQHRLIQADVMTWLSHDEDYYDLIFCDPPTFSNSARADDFDLQRQHVTLLQAVMSRLAPEGTVYFSNNFRRFRLNSEAIHQFARCHDITAQTIDRDFANRPTVHRTWRLHHRH